MKVVVNKCMSDTIYGPFIENNILYEQRICYFGRASYVYDARRLDVKILCTYRQ